VGTPRFRPPGFQDGAFTHCKLMYRSVRREANGMGWATDYPYAAINLLTRVKELTKTRVSMGAEGEPNYWVVRASDSELFNCPFTMATDVGTAFFDEAEVENLRAYLLKGGFLWVDDFWGTRAWDQWSGEMRKVLPDHQIVDVPADHPIRTSMFTVKTLPQVTSINFWRRSGGDTSERGPDSPVANFRMIADPQGHHGAHDPQHRHRRCVGARGRRPRVLPAVLAGRLRRRHQRRALHAHPLSAAPLQRLRASRLTISMMVPHV
jgi:hypothetical protein